MKLVITLIRKFLWKHPKLLRISQAVRRRASLIFFESLRAIHLPGPLALPRGTFSAYKLVREKKIKGRIEMDCQKVPVIAPDSLRKVCGLRQDEMQPWPIFWSHHQNINLIGKSLLLQLSDSRVCLEAAYTDHCLKHDPGYRYLKLDKPFYLKGNWTSVISMWSGGFYHWFLDALPRLAFLSEFPPDTCILVPDPLASFQKQTLQWLGLENRVRPTKEGYLKVEDFYFSSPTAMSGCYDPYAINFLRRSFEGMADRSFQSPKRFYIQRIGKTRSMLNENEIIDYFKGLGWGIIEMEQLSMAQQIQLFSQADVICGPHGAAFTNLLWCRPGCKVIELVPSTWMNGVYEGLADVLKLDYKYMICPAAEVGFNAKVNLKELRHLIEG